VVGALMTTADTMLSKSPSSMSGGGLVLDEQPLHCASFDNVKKVVGFDDMDLFTLKLYPWSLMSMKFIYSIQYSKRDCLLRRIRPSPESAVLLSLISPASNRSRDAASFPVLTV
jgi:hypothetical protein